MDLTRIIPDFDLGPFLQEDVDYLGEDGSSASTSTLPELGHKPVSPPTSEVVRRTAYQKRRFERKGHTKSRRGCYNCKRRRIKCQETHPACGHCAKSGLICEYPAVPQVTHQDMRFFQHFLLSCSPHQPLGNESVWTHEVPCLSQNYEYLMHAILGLAASDLMRHDPSLVTFAMTHRLKAIRAIKKTLAEAPKTGDGTFDEGNALMATCYALTFQSVMLDDGMAEFMTFCRGIMLVIIQMYCRGARFVFSNFIDDVVMSLIKPVIEQVPLTKTEWTDMAVAGIRGLGDLCKHPVEVEYHALILEMAATLYTSSYLAFQMLSKHYGWWMQMPHESFQYLIDPANPVCTLLGSHWISLKQIMAPIIETEKRFRRERSAQTGDEGGMDMGIVRWLKYLNRQLDAEYVQYNLWPVWVEERLDGDITFFGKTLS